MTVYDKLFLAAYFLGIMIVQAIWQHRLFKANKPISHKLHAVYYCLAILPMIYFFSAWWWQVIVLGVIERLALYDVVLNCIRGKTPILTYNGNGTTGSWVDRWENSLSLWAVTALKLTYIVIFIIVLIIV
jgi:hypothetical protein